MSTILTVRQLSKRYSGGQALDDVDVDDQLGEAPGLVGRNGPRATTVLQCCTGAPGCAQRAKAADRVTGGLRPPSKPGARDASANKSDASVPGSAASCTTVEAARSCSGHRQSGTVDPESSRSIGSSFKISSARSRVIGGRNRNTGVLRRRATTHVVRSGEV